MEYKNRKKEFVKFLNSTSLMKNEKNSILYLIDFLDTFYNTWVADVSKLFQDLTIGWSFRNDLISENVKLRVLLLNKHFCFNLDKLLQKDNITWSDVYHYLMLDLVRIYVHNKRFINDGSVNIFIVNSLNVLNEINHKEFYEYINNSMCWPLYQVS